MPPASKKDRRAASGRSFFLMIAIACIATVLVIVWTVRTSAGEARTRRARRLSHVRPLYSLR